MRNGLFRSALEIRHGKILQRSVSEKITYTQT